MSWPAANRNTATPTIADSSGVVPSGYFAVCQLRQHIGPRVRAPILDVADKMARQVLENGIGVRSLLSIDVTGRRSRCDHFFERVAVIRGNAQQVGNHQRDIGNSDVLNQLAFPSGDDVPHGLLGKFLHIRLVCFQARGNEQTGKQRAIGGVARTVVRHEYVRAGHLVTMLLELLGDVIAYRFERQRHGSAGD